MVLAKVLEAAMIIIFGLSWPVAIAKTLQVRKVHGKSVWFLYLVLSGYICGVAAKFVTADGGWPDWVTPFYAINAALVSVEIVLYYRFRQPPGGAGLDIEPESPATEVTQARP